MLYMHTEHFETVSDDIDIDIVFHSLVPSGRPLWGLDTRLVGGPFQLIGSSLFYLPEPGVCCLQLCLI